MSEKVLRIASKTLRVFRFGVLSLNWNNRVVFPLEKKLHCPHVQKNHPFMFYFKAPKLPLNHSILT